MTEMQTPSGFGLDGQRGSFKRADVAEQNIEQQAFILDQMAARPAVRTLKSWALAQLAPAPGETAVDVGSGTGEDVVAFAERVSPDGRRFRRGQGLPLHGRGCHSSLVIRRIAHPTAANPAACSPHPTRSSE